MAILAFFPDPLASIKRLIAVLYRRRQHLRRTLQDAPLAVANGNQTSRGADSFTWSHENQLKQAVIGGSTTNYVYNGDGLRKSKDVGGVINSYDWSVRRSLPVILEDLRHGVWGVLRRRGGGRGP